MRRPSLLLVVALVALVAPLGAGAQTSKADALRDRLQRSVDAATFAAVTRVADDAARRGLPAEPILNKALEGATMRTPAATIRTAVERVAARLDVARTALAPATPDEMVAGAYAIAAGVPSATLREIRKLQPDEPVHVPVGVLTQLVASKVPVQRAYERVAELMRSGTRPPQLIALGNEVADDVDGGRDPIASVDVRTRGILAGSGGAATMPTTAPAENFGGGGVTNSSGDGRNLNNSGRPPAARPPRRP
jgi:hypothetical protein